MIVFAVLEINWFIAGGSMNNCKNINIELEKYLLGEKVRSGFWHLTKILKENIHRTTDCLVLLIIVYNFKVKQRKANYCFRIYSYFHQNINGNK